MILDRTVIIQSKTTTKDSEGMTIEVWTASQTTESANRQPSPYAGEMMSTEYGLSLAKVSKLYFLRSSTVATESNRIVDGSDTYEIYLMKRYPNHCEAITKPVTI